MRMTSVRLVAQESLTEASYGCTESKVEVIGMANWEAKFVKCPFYRNHGSNKIACEGLAKGNTINLVYENQADRSKYMHDHCYSIDGFHTCPIYQLLERQYE